jgi:hypothetical protein
LLFEGWVSSGALFVFSSLLLLLAELLIFLSFAGSEAEICGSFDSLPLNAC